MSRKTIISILLFFSWPVNNLHRIWRKEYDVPVRWFLTDTEDTKAWYFYHLFSAVSYFMIFLAVWLHATATYKRNDSFRTLFGAMVIIQGFDVPFFMICRKESVWGLGAEGAILLASAILILWKKKKQLRWTGR